MNRSTWTLACAAALLVDPASAQSLGDLMKQATSAMPVTTAPASFLLGAGGEAVPRLTSVRDVAVHLGRGLDAQGHIAQSVGVELLPAYAMGRLSWEDIDRSPLAKIWSRTAVSFATDTGAEDGARGAVGVQTLLYAPALDAALLTFAKPDCGSSLTTLRQLGDTPPPPVPTGPASAPVALTDAALKVIKECGQRVQDVLNQFNQPLLALGAGRTLGVRGTTGASEARDTSSVWLSAAFGAAMRDGAPVVTPMGMGPLVTLHARWTTQVPMTDAAGQTVWARQRLLGSNLRYGNARMAFIGEWSITRSRAGSADLPDRRRGLLGLEFQIDPTQDLFFTVGVARDSGADAATRALLAKVNWGFGKQAALR